MVSLCDLPPEILLYVIQHLGVKDISALSRSGSRYIRDVATPVLYSRVNDVPDILCWACDKGLIGTVRWLLAAGTNPNASWRQIHKRSAALGATSDVYLGIGDSWMWKSRRPRPETDAFLAEERQARVDDADELRALDSDQDEDEGNDLDQGNELEDNYSDSDFDSDSDSVSSLETGLSRLEYDSDGYEIIDDRYIWTPLHIAACRGHDDIIELLLDHGARVNASSRGFCNCVFAHEMTRKNTPEHSTPFWTPLHTAICYGRDSPTRLLLSRGASVVVATRVDGDKRAKVTALHVACAAGVVSIARFLLENHQPDLEMEDHHGQTPLSWAYFTGMWQTINFLVENGATLNARLGSSTLLRHACMKHRFSEALRFIELGADVYAGSYQGSKQRSPWWSLRFCCRRKDWRKEIKHMDLGVALRAKRQKHVREQTVEALFQVDLKNAVKLKPGMDLKDQWTMPLKEAALDHLPTVVVLLLETLREHDNAHTKAELFCILQSTLGSHSNSPKGALLETVKAFLAFMPKYLTKADILQSIAATCGNGTKRNDKEAVVRLLCEQRNDVNLNKKSFRKLLWPKAIDNGNVNLCIALVDKGLKPPSPKELDRFVSDALWADSVAALEYFLTLDGASETVLTGPVLHKAIYDQRTRCAIFLIDQGAPVNYHTPAGDPCLLQASMLRENEIAYRLLEKGADPNVRGFNIPETPLVMATVKKDEELIDKLLQHGASVHGQEGDTSALTTAMFMGFRDGVSSMVYSSSFTEATEDKRNRYISIALSLPDDAWSVAAMFDCILRGSGVDPNCVFWDLGGLTPLHLAVIRPRPFAFARLVKHGADMHRRPGVPSGVVDEDVINVSKTTPLEFAIQHADPSIVCKMLNLLPLNLEVREAQDCLFPRVIYEESEDRLFPRVIDEEVEYYLFPPVVDDLHKVMTPQLRADYVRAACYRMKASMFAVLVDFKLDFRIRDPRTGDTALHMVCDGMKRHTKEPNWEPKWMAARAASAILLLLEDISVDPRIENNAGVSALQLARQTMEYSGDDSFWNEVAEVWEDILVVDDDGIHERPERF